MSSENTSRLLQLMNNERRYRLFFYQIMEFCRSPRSYMQVQEQALNLLKNQAAIQAPEVLIQWLEEFGGIRRTIVDQESCWQTTPEGLHVLESEHPMVKLQELLDSHPERAPLFLEILRYCDTPRQRVDIEEFIKGNPVFQNSGFYLSNLLNELENISCLNWVDKRWRTNGAVKGAIV
jgi:hypothetical protein